MTVIVLIMRVSMIVIADRCVLIFRELGRRWRMGMPMSVAMTAMRVRMSLWGDQQTSKSEAWRTYMVVVSPHSKHTK